MVRFRLIIIAIVVLLIVIFAIQNSDSINLKLFFWEVRIPKALLIIISICVGLIAGMFFFKL